jgi:hypothetical protein
MRHTTWVFRSGLAVPLIALMLAATTAAAALVAKNRPYAPTPELWKQSSPTTIKLPTFIIIEQSVY